MLRSSSSTTKVMPSPEPPSRMDERSNSLLVPSDSSLKSNSLPPWSKTAFSSTSRPASRLTRKTPALPRSSAVVPSARSWDTLSMTVRGMPDSSEPMRRKETDVTPVP